MDNNLMTIMRLLEFTDSAFPVGTFSFSNGLETASFENLVSDASSLEEFTRAQARQAAHSDGIAAVLTHRAFLRGDYEAIRNIDEALICFKLNDEARLMLKRMGKKLAELSCHLFDNELISRWLEDIRNGLVPGTYPVAQGIVFAAAGIGERDLFASHQFGAMNMVVSAALRCVKVSHYDTQKILFRLSSETDTMYEEIKNLGMEDMNAFFPQLDILASLHEKGNMRMFMN